MVEAGSVINGKYRVDRVLGAGGMGVVVAAHHLALDRPVAIKLLRPELLVHPEIVSRFAREARAASKIESDHTARVMDVDALDDGTPFLVMEYLEGTDLSIVRESGQGLPFPVAVAYVLEACEAIAEAHRLGIVHRDLKPANLFLATRADGRVRVKVLDFGISKVSESRGGSDLGATQTSMVMGSVEYMSPEQMLSARDVDARTDIWSLGVVAYELLTARVPFPGETTTQVYARAMTQPAAPVRGLRPEVPEALDAAVLRCLESDRSRRFASVGELMAALRPFAEGAQGTAGLSAESLAARNGAGRTAVLGGLDRARSAQTTSDAATLVRLGSGASGRTVMTSSGPAPIAQAPRRTAGLAMGTLAVVGAGLLVGRALVGGREGAAAPVVVEHVVTAAPAPASKVREAPLQTLPALSEPAATAAVRVTVVPGAAALLVDAAPAILDAGTESAPGRPEPAAVPGVSSGSVGAVQTPRTPPTATEPRPVAVPLAPPSRPPARPAASDSKRSMD